MSPRPVTLNANAMSTNLRTKTWRPETRELLVARLGGSDQEADLTEPPNCGGVGRLRHFRRATSQGWPSNPIPIDPAERFLGRDLGEVAVAQVFQNLACNWRCWYCYVPFNLLSGDVSRGEFCTASELVRRYLEESDPPPIIDISGGQPDLVPEWTLDTLRAVNAAGIQNDTFVWSDDNLSSDYMWRYLTKEEVRWMADQPNHSRVGCFKGFDEESFVFNTRAHRSFFSEQFELFRRLCQDGFDLYGYITLTSPSDSNIEAGVVDTLDRLQDVHQYAPLRVVPLEIISFGTVKDRLNRKPDLLAPANAALIHQEIAIAVWNIEMERRFTDAERAVNICDVEIAAG